MYLLKVKQLMYNPVKKEVAILLGLVERPGSIKRRVRHPLFL